MLFRSIETCPHICPLLRPPNYNKYLLLYLVGVESTIGMVLVQEDDLLEEHVIYYLSRGLVGPELNYSHANKLVLVAVVSLFEIYNH